MAKAKQEANNWIEFLELIDSFLPYAIFNDTIDALKTFKESWLNPNTRWLKLQKNLKSDFLSKLNLISLDYSLSFQAPAVTTDILSLECARNIYDDFLTAVITQNTEYLEQLKLGEATFLLQNQTADNDTQLLIARKLAFITRLKANIIDNPAKITAATDIRHAIEKITKIKIHYAVIEEPEELIESEESEESEPEELEPIPPSIIIDDQLLALIDEFEALRHEHDAWILRGQELTSLPHRNTDIILKPLIDNFEAIIASLSPSIAEVLKLQCNFGSNDDHDNLRQSLINVIPKLNEANQKHKECNTDIRKRCAFIIPATNDLTVLQSLANDALGTLKTELTQLLVLVTQIEAQAHFKPDDKKLFSSTIESFATQLYDALKPIALSKSVRTSLYDRIMRHLGFKKRYGIFTQALVIDDAIKLVESMFNESFVSTKPQVYQTRIANFHNAIAIVGLSPIKRMLDYSTYLLTDKSQHVKLLQNYDECLKQSTSLQDILPPVLTLMGNLGNTYSVNLATETHAEIGNVHQALINLQQEITDETTRINAIEDKLERFDALTSFEHTKLTQLEAMRIKLDNLTIIANDHVSNLQRIYDMSKAGILKSIEGLKVDLIKGLDYAAPDKKAKILAYEKDCSDFIEQSKTDPTTTLPRLNRSQASYLVTYTAHLMQIKLDIKGRILPSMQTIYKQVFPYIPLTLLPQNPYANTDILTSKRKDEEKAYQALEDTFLELEGLKGCEISHWDRRLSSKSYHLSNCTKDRKEADKHAAIINERLQKPSYIACISNLENLINEFLRIVNEYIDETIQKHPNNDVIQKIKENPRWILTLSEEELEAQQQSLNLIDKRLYRIAHIIMMFNQLNASYINLDIFHCDDKAYLTRLKSHVQTFLTNNHMEDLSDGKRSASLQYTRKHIIRPLSDFYRELVKQLSGGKYYNNGKVHLTIFACRTEREFIKTGNEMRRTLSRITASA